MIGVNAEHVPPVRLSGEAQIRFAHHHLAEETTTRALQRLLNPR